MMMMHRHRDAIDSVVVGASSVGTIVMVIDVRLVIGRVVLVETPFWGGILESECCVCTRLMVLIVDDMMDGVVVEEMVWRVSGEVTRDGPSKLASIGSNVGCASSCSDMRRDHPLLLMVLDRPTPNPVLSHQHLIASTPRPLAASTP